MRVLCLTYRNSLSARCDYLNTPPLLTGQAKAAVANGADAIYFGLSDFNARARAANFDPGEELVELMRFLHENGVKGCVCERELSLGGGDDESGWKGAVTVHTLTSLFVSTRREPKSWAGGSHLR